MKSELADFNTVSHYAVQYDYLQPMEKTVELIRVFESRSRNELGPNNEFGYLFDAFELNDNYEDVFVDISLDLQSMDTTKTLPFVVVRLDTYYMSLKLTSSDDISLNTGKEEHYHYHLSAPLQEDCQGKSLNIYLYNKSGGAMRYENVKIQVSGARKS